MQSQYEGGGFKPGQRGQNPVHRVGLSPKGPLRVCAGTLPAPEGGAPGQQSWPASTSGSGAQGLHPIQTADVK